MKLVNPDAAKPAVDLEQRALVEALIRLLLGDQVGLWDPADHFCALGAWLLQCH